MYSVPKKMFHIHIKKCASFLMLYADIGLCSRTGLGFCWDIIYVNYAREIDYEIDTSQGISLYILSF